MNTNAITISQSRIMSPTEMMIIQACRESLESLYTKDAGNPYRSFLLFCKQSGQNFTTIDGRMEGSSDPRNRQSLKMISMF